MSDGNGARPPDVGPRSATIITPETNDALLACSGNAVRTWLILRWHRNVRTRASYPSVARMARMMKVSEPTVLRALQELEGASLIARAVARGKATVYRFPVEESGKAHVTTPIETGNASDTSSGNAGDTTPDRGGITHAPGVVTSRLETGITGGGQNGPLNGPLNGGGAPPPSSPAAGTPEKIAAEYCRLDPTVPLKKAIGHVQSALDRGADPKTLLAKILELSQRLKLWAICDLVLDKPKAPFVPMQKVCAHCSGDPLGVFDGMKDGEKTYIRCRFCAGRVEPQTAKTGGN